MIEFTYPIRIYYEDTDAVGIVYHTNYLKFIERTRTEWLRHLGLTHYQLKEHYQLAFVVRSLAIEYIKPAFLDDYLIVTLKVLQTKKASLIIFQEVLKSSERLCTATIKLACVNITHLRPQPFPKEISKIFHDATRATA